MMRRLVFTSEKTGIESVPSKLWYAYQKNGDFIHLYRTLGLLFRVFEDGSAIYSCKINSNLRDPIMGSVEHNLISIGTTFYRMDQSIAARREVVVTGMPSAITSGPDRTMWLEKESKLLYINDSGVISVYTIETDTSVTGPVGAGNVDTSSVSGWKQLTPYKAGRLLAYNKTNGRIVILHIADLLSGLDAEAAKITDTALGNGFDYMWYNPWNKIFCGIKESTGIVKVYTDLVQPDTLSNPELLDIVSPLHPVQGTRIRTRLTSVVTGHPTQAFEPVKDWLVDWNLLGLGSIQRSQSKTDEDGYADNYYFGPLTGAGLPVQEELDVSIQD